MSRIAPPAEKILAVAAIYERLIDELHLVPPGVVPDDHKPGELYLSKSAETKIEYWVPPTVMAALIDASVRIAMSTDTRDMGILMPREMAQRKAMDNLTPSDPDPFTPHVDVESTP